MKTPAERIAPSQPKSRILFILIGVAIALICTVAFWADAQNLSSSLFHSVTQEKQFIGFSDIGKTSIKNVLDGLRAILN